MISKVYSGALNGLESFLVTVETDIFQQGLPAMIIVGLADKAVAEAKERMLSAIKNSGLELPSHRIVINLSPANIQKEGTIYDLPMTIALLKANSQLMEIDLDKSLFLGELALDGRLTKIKGALPLAILAKNARFKNLFVPKENAQELSLIDGINIYPITNLKDLILHLRQVKIQLPLNPMPLNSLRQQTIYETDFADIIEQSEGKRALEIAASGFHNLILNGPPGTGKTLLARALPSILPSLDKEEVLETTKIYSIAGMLTMEKPLVLHPPFRSPHHSISRNGLVGGGSRPLPGEISLAHRGVLFLDEMAEFPRSVLEALRQPLEDGYVVISRASGNATFPTRFILIATVNPCPCGNLGNPKKNCYCTPTQILRYKKRISGPILDRIDLHVYIPFVPAEKLQLNSHDQENSAVIRKRIILCRERQNQRYRNCRVKTNGELNTKEVKEFCHLSLEAETLLKNAINKYNLSIRSYFKIIKVAKTVSDLANKDLIDTSELFEAIQYRISE